MVLKKVSTAALKLLYSSSGDLRQFGNAELAVDFADDVAFQTANDFTLTLPIFCAFLDISERWFVASHPDDGDAVQGCIGLPVSASVQSKAVCFPA
jgi:hypothetical protein